MADAIRRGGVTRRRAISLFGAAAGIAAVPWMSTAAPVMRRWTGTALGAHAAITLAHPDERAANTIFERAAAEIARLERIFSLHDPESELSRLNRDGSLSAPSHDLILVLSEARRLGEATGGAFDVTVQPLWRLYAAHFANRPEAVAGPDEKAVAAALAAVDYRRIDAGPSAVTFARPGMAATLNGIAQGYITDRVADLLRDHGVDRVLLDLGEHRGVGAHPEGRPWRIGLIDPDAPGSIAQTVDLTDRAVATSGGYGTQFSRDGRHHHLFDPMSGESANAYRSVSVIARRAMTADALSTALYVAAPERASGILGAIGPASAIVTDAAGRTYRLGTLA